MVIWIQEKVNKIMSKLPKSIEDLEADKKYIMPYIQHSKEIVDMVEFEFLELCSDALNSDVYRTLNKSGSVHRQGIVGRYLDDSGNYVLYGAWSRFMCIDINYREWIQPYYAINHSNYKVGECTCINDKFPELISYFRDIKLNDLLDGI